MLGHRRRSHLEDGRQVADTELGGLVEKDHDLEPGFAGQERIVIGGDPQAPRLVRQSSPKGQQILRCAVGRNAVEVGSAHDRGRSPEIFGWESQNINISLF